jgi:putative ubiquitin-RnfH superfamily antitoxin RatB of RatAB toxin-antitoxin module
MQPAEHGATVCVVYALPEEQVIVELELNPGLTAKAAVERSGLLDRYPEILGQELLLGIFGADVPHEHVLEAGDRVEISRPLLTDPRDRRRELLNDGRVMSGANAPQPKLRKKARD